MYRKPLHGWQKHLDFIVLDLLCWQAALILAYWCRHGFERIAYSVPIYATLAIVVALIDFLIIVFFNNFSDVLKRGYYVELAATFKNCLIVAAVTTVFMFLTQSSKDYSRTVLILMFVFALIISYVVRIVYKRSLKKHFVAAKRNMMIITTSARVRDILKNLEENAAFLFHITGIVLTDCDAEGTSIDDIPVVANKDTVCQYICREWIDEVFLYLPNDHPETRQIYETLMSMGVVVHVSLENLTNFKNQHQEMEKIGGYTVLTTCVNSISRNQMIGKRLLDIIGGLLGCVAAGIICLIFAPKIKKESPGPVIFKQERVGKNGRHFMLYKIRTMYPDAEERKAALMKENDLDDDLMFKMKWDPRVIGNKILPDGTKVTGIGDYLRTRSLDEFPQFLNVLKGEMSLVGTRPPTVDEWNRYELHHRTRLAIKPGITGLWQISGRNEITDFEEVVRLDEEYISNWSSGLDAKILFRTVSAVFKKKGAM